jgi:hypothetical protein
MASGKSLELAQIKPAAPRALCCCGAEWDTHMRKDGKGILKRFENPNHQPTGLGLPQFNRKQRRAMRKYNGERTLHCSARDHPHQ